MTTAVDQWILELAEGKYSDNPQNLISKVATAIAALQALQNAIPVGNQNPNFFYAGPGSGGAAPPGFRALVSADLNSIAGQIPGTATNDNAAAGMVGEYVQSTVLGGAGITPGSGIVADITSIPLTAGDWNVGGIIAASAVTTLTNVQGWTNSASVTKPAIPNGGFLDWQGSLANQTISFAVGQERYSLAAPGNAFLSCQVVGTGALLAYGKIWARRAR